MNPIAHPKLSQRIAASPLNLAVVVGLLVAILVPATLDEPQAAQGAVVAHEQDAAASLRAEAEAFGGHHRLVAYIAARQGSAAGAEAADLSNLLLMLDGYRDVHEEIGTLLRAGKPADAARSARLAMAVLGEVRGSMAFVGSGTIGIDETTPSPLPAAQPMAVAARGAK